MYDKYPEYDVPQQNIIQMFFAQRWSAILIEMAMAIVITVAAGRAFDFFEPIDIKTENPPQEQAITQADTDGGISLDAIKAYGMDYIRQKRYAEAEAVYDLAVLAEPQNADNYAWRGYANIQAGDYADARRDYSKLVELAPNSFNGHNSLCWTHGELLAFETALSHCRRALELADSPLEYALAYENRCWVYVEAGDYESAYDDCMQAFALQPNCAHHSCALAHFNIGRILLADGDEAAALAHFHRAGRLGSDYADMYFDMAEIYDKLGYASAAATNYEKYMEIVGKNEKPVIQWHLSALHGE